MNFHFQNWRCDCPFLFFKIDVNSPTDTYSRRKQINIICNVYLFLMFGHFINLASSILTTHYTIWDELFGEFKKCKHCNECMRIFYWRHNKSTTIKLITVLWIYIATKFFAWYTYFLEQAGNKNTFMLLHFLLESYRLIFFQCVS